MGSPDTELNLLPRGNARCRIPPSTQPTESAFDVLAGTTTKGGPRAGQARRFLAPIQPSAPFGYFRAIHDTPGTLRYIGPDGEVHHVHGTSGGQQGDPLEMMRLCATVHPVWARVMERYERARALAFADDGFVRSSLVDCLHILAVLKTAFKEDGGLYICLPKCKIYTKGLTLAKAREKVQRLMEADEALRSLKDILRDSSLSMTTPRRTSCKWRG